MEFRQLTYFVEVAQTLNFTQAAENLFVAQPAISKSIQKLEQELQVYLIDRSAKHIVLTPEGEVFLEHARAVLQKVKEAETAMNEMRGLEKGEIKIGLPSMIGSYFFPPLIKEFKKMYPHVQIIVVEEGAMQIQRLVERKEIDLGIIIVDQPPEELHYFPLVREEMVVCVPTHHPLAGSERISNGEMIQEPLILFKEGYYQRYLMLEWCRKKGVTPNVTFSSNQLSLIKSFVYEGLGITLILRKIVETDPKLCAIPLDPPIFLNFAVAWSKHTYLSKATQAFIDFLRTRKK